MTSRVEPPVVMASSTTTTFLAGLQRETAPERHRAVLVLGEQRTAAQRAGDLVGDQDSAQGGRHHGSGHAAAEQGAQERADRLSQARGPHRVHEDPAHWT